MSDAREERIGALLREALPPVPARAQEPDLWPAMRARLRAPRVMLSTLDWVLAAALVVALLVFPHLIPGLLYHL